MASALSGCSFVPSVSIRPNFYQNGDQLILITESDGSNHVDIRIFDTEKTTFIKRAAIKDINRDGLIKLIKPLNQMFLSVKTADQKCKVDAYQTIYNLHLDGSLEVIGQAEGDIIGVDDRYFYAIKRQRETTVNGNGSSEECVRLLPFRYDKSLTKRIDRHFSDYPDMIVMNINKDDNTYWYTCFRDPVEIGDVYGRKKLYGTINLISRSIETNHIDYIFYENNIPSDFSTLCDRDALWFICGDRIIKYEKSTRDFSEIYNDRAFFPFENWSETAEKEPLWAYLPRRNVVRSFGNAWGGMGRGYHRLSDISLKKMKHDCNFWDLSPLYFDDTSLWMIGKKDKRINPVYRGDITYLVKINKKDPREYSTFLLWPSAYESVKLITLSFIGNVFILPVLCFLPPM